MRSEEMRVVPYRQAFDETRIKDVYAEARASMAACPVSFAPGERIAIAVGSRGIANIAQITKAVADHVKEKGASPFILPAMGSHGGATAEGQASVLASYGVTEENVGAPIVSSLAVVKLAQVRPDFNLYMARDALDAGGVIVINRVKPHTDFHGPVESGLMKMLVIGLGKHRQALETHAHGVFGLRTLIPEAARIALASGKIRMGVGIVENALDQTLRVEAAPGAGIPELDGRLLRLARAGMARLPVDTLDLLVVDQIGKDISGTGMDTHVIGRVGIAGEADPDTPDIRMIAAFSLTEASHGNALGMGLCDVITQAFRDAVDFQTTYENVVTSSFLKRGMMPVVARDERQAVDWALRAVGPRTPDTLRAIHIRDTLHLKEMLVTPAVMREIEAR